MAKLSSLRALGLLAACVLPAPVLAQTFFPTDDATVKSDYSTTNFGAAPNLQAGGTGRAFIKFALPNLPGGFGSANVSKATLVLWVNVVGGAGNIQVSPVTSTWNESSITYAAQPSVGTTPVGTIAVSSGSQFIYLDITTLFQSWVSNSATNFGIVVDGLSGALIFLDSKESVATSHQPTIQMLEGVAAGSGNVTGSSLSSGQLITGNGSSSIQTGNLSGDVTTSGSTTTAIGKIQGTTVSGTQGSSGSKVQLSAGSTTSGDFVKFDSSGNTIDGGTVTINTTSPLGGGGTLAPGGSLTLTCSGCTGGGGGGGSGGGVNSQSANYSAVSGDAGKLITMNGSNLTLTLPSTPISSTWLTYVENLNATPLTITTSTAHLNGGNSSITLNQFQMIEIWANATDYFTSPALAGSSNVTLTAAANGITISLPATISSNTTGNAATANALAASPNNCLANQYTTGIAASGAALNCTTLAPSATTDTTNANNITSGTLNIARLTTNGTAGAVVLGTQPTLTQPTLTKPSLGLNYESVTYTSATSSAGSPQILTTVANASRATDVTTGTSSGVIGIATAGAANGGSVEVAISGLVACAFDATAVTAGDWVQISTTVPGRCHDTGSSSVPTSGGQLIGLAMASGGASSSQTIRLFDSVALPQGAGGGGSGSPASPSGSIQYNNGGNFGAFTANGDATINTSSGLVTVTKTNGTAFASSATTDTTNAANISSGILPTARLATSGSGNTFALAASPALTSPTLTTPSLGTSFMTVQFTSAGSTLNRLQILNSSGQALNALTTTTSGVIGISQATTGSGTIQVAVSGLVSCDFDATAVNAGDWVQISSTVAGKCHDATATLPTSGGQIIGLAMTSGGVTTTQTIRLFDSVALPQSAGGGTPAGSSGAIQYNNGGSFGAFTTSGDANIVASTGVVTVSKVNSVAYGTNPATNTVPVVTGTNAITYETVPNAALTGGGAVTITPGTGLSGGGSVALGGSVTLNCSGCGGSAPALNAQTGNYTAVTGDSGKLITLTGNNLTLTLPGTVPTSGWNIYVQNLDPGASSVTVSPAGGKTINGGSSSLTLRQYVLVHIWSDGSNYFSTLPPLPGANVTLTSATNGLTISSSGGGASGDLKMSMGAAGTCGSYTHPYGIDTPSNDVCGSATNGDVITLPNNPTGHNVIFLDAHDGALLGGYVMPSAALAGAGFILTIIDPKSNMDNLSGFGNYDWAVNDGGTPPGHADTYCGYNVDPSGCAGNWVATIGLTQGLVRPRSGFSLISDGNSKWYFIAFM